MIENSSITYKNYVSLFNIIDLIFENYVTDLMNRVLRMNKSVRSEQIKRTIIIVTTISIVVKKKVIIIIKNWRKKKVKKRGKVTRMWRVCLRIEILFLSGIATCGRKNSVDWENRDCFLSVLNDRCETTWPLCHWLKLYSSRWCGVSKHCVDRSIDKINWYPVKYRTKIILVVSLLPFDN